MRNAAAKTSPHSSKPWTCANWICTISRKSRRNLACGDITLRPSAEWYILTSKPTSEEEMEVGAGFPVHHGGRLPRYAT